MFIMNNGTIYKRRSTEFVKNLVEISVGREIRFRQKVRATLREFSN